MSSETPPLNPHTPSEGASSDEGSGEKSKSKNDEAIDRLLGDGCQFGEDLESRPVVSIPDYAIFHNLRVDSPAFKDYIVSRYYEKYGGQLLKGENLNFLLCRIRDRCRREGTIPSNLAAADIEKNPVLRGILEHMYENSALKGLTGEVHKKLLALEKDKSNFATNPLTAYLPVFGRRIKELALVFPAYGICFSSDHREGGTHLELTRTDAFFERILPARPAIPSTDGDDGADGNPTEEPSAASADEQSTSSSADSTDGNNGTEPQGE